MNADNLKARTKEFALRIIGAKLPPAQRVRLLLEEANELVAIFVASKKSPLQI